VGIFPETTGEATATQEMVPSLASKWLPKRGESGHWEERVFVD